jgi:hypothetical protein
MNNIINNTKNKNYKLYKLKLSFSPSKRIFYKINQYKLNVFKRLNKFNKQKKFNKYNKYNKPNR